MKNRSNPVHEYNGKWWFWDEIWVHRMGPYETKEEVAEALKKYCLEQLGYSKEELNI